MLKCQRDLDVDSGRGLIHVLPIPKSSIYMITVKAKLSEGQCIGFTRDLVGFDRCIVFSVSTRSPIITTFYMAR